MITRVARFDNDFLFLKNRRIKQFTHKLVFYYVMVGRVQISDVKPTNASILQNDRYSVVLSERLSFFFVSTIMVDTKNDDL